MSSILGDSRKHVVSQETLAQLRDVSTATISLQLLKRGVRSTFMSGVRPLNTDDSRFVAEAHTLRFVPMREDLSTPDVLADKNYAPRKVVEQVPADAVLVIDGRSRTDCGVIGGILALRLRQRGCAAIVTDGAVRDSAELAQIGIPVFCAGAAAPATLNGHFGADEQTIIGCGGVAVIPGDILAGDGDGVILIPRALAAEIAKDGAEQERLESFLTSLIADGRPLIGTYPPNEETRRLYDEWVQKQES